jgi:biopolymer transport protein ExbB
MRSARRVVLVLVSLAALGGAYASASQDQDASGAPEAPTAPSARVPGAGVRSASSGPAAGVGRRSVLQLFAHANPMLWPLGLCSVVALGFALERLVALRRSRVIPRDFVQRFTERLATGKLDRDRAVELCKAQESPVARIFAHAVRYWGQPAALIRQAIDADAAAEVLELKRNVRVLNATATLAPLLGLLGTVIGLIEAFDALGVGGMRTGVSKSEQLAHGISLALVTTALGLAIAVISVALYYYLLHRADVLVRELDDQVSRVIDLVAAEAGQALPDRRGGVVTSDLYRLESRTLGRSDPVRAE